MRLGRIPKADVQRVFTTVIDMARKAKGGDSILSRADAKAFVSTFVSERLRTVAANVIGYTDHRDAKKGARITDRDLAKAETFFTTRVAELDTNGNGLSAKELKATESEAIRAAVDYVRMEEGADGTSAPAPTGSQN